MIAAIYTRKSNEQNDRDVADKSVTHQEERAREYIAQKGWTVAEEHIYKDDGISGAEFSKRPDLVRLLRDIERRPRPPFQVLVMADESRLGRETIETSYALLQIVQADVRVFFYLDDRERTLDSPLDKITLAVTAFADELKRVKDGQAVYDKVATKARHGFVVGCRVFGYDNVEVKGPSGKRSHVERALNEAQAAVVRRIFAMSAAGTGYSRIAKILNTEDAPAPKPKRGRLPGWSHSTVKTILDRRLYLGEAVWGRTKKRDKWGRKNLTRRPESEWIRAEVPPIVTDAEWRAAHDRIDTARQRTQAVGGALGNRRARDVDSQFLLSGFARCSECGNTLGVLSGGRARRRVYGCSRNHKTALCANRLRLPIERVDDAVLQAIIDQVLTETVVEAVVERVMMRLSPNVVSSDMQELRASLVRVQREIDNLATAIARGGEFESLLKKLSACERERNDLRAAIKGRERVEGQRIVRTKVEAGVRLRVENWRELLNRRKTHARQLLREMLAGPITFERAGQVYRFRGEASFGALAGEAGGTPLMVPVLGFNRLRNADAPPSLILHGAVNTAA